MMVAGLLVQSIWKCMQRLSAGLSVRLTKRPPFSLLVHVDPQSALDHPYIILALKSRRRSSRTRRVIHTVRRTGFKCLHHSANLIFLSPLIRVGARRGCPSWPRQQKFCAPSNTNPPAYFVRGLTSLPLFRSEMKILPLLFIHANLFLPFENEESLCPYFMKAS